jgi:hypothetical protein
MKLTTQGKKRSVSISQWKTSFAFFAVALGVLVGAVRGFFMTRLAPSAQGQEAPSGASALKERTA